MVKCHISSWIRTWVGEQILLTAIIAITWVTIIWPLILLASYAHMGTVVKWRLITSTETCLVRK